MRPGLAGSRGLECLPGAETLLQLLHPAAQPFRRATSITLLHQPQGGAGDRAQLTSMEGDACSGDIHSAVPPR